LSILASLVVLASVGIGLAMVPGGRQAPVGTNGPVAFVRSSGRDADIFLVDAAGVSR
jgi:hypothetical protein